jgi:hypothetical protein
MQRRHRPFVVAVTLSAITLFTCALAFAVAAEIGREVAVARHLADGEEHELPIQTVVAHGQRLFSAMWTAQEGGGRPLTKGSGGPLADPEEPLVFPRNFNRVSAPDANSCAGCHNAPFGVPGGGGDIVANVFVLGQRFDFATFGDDVIATKGSLDEAGLFSTLDGIANSRATTGMFGAGYLEMLARQMTAELQAIRDGLAPGQSVPLVAKGVSFGTLAREVDGSWDTEEVEGLPAPSVRSTGADAPPSLVVMPWHQASAVVSLRQFSNNALNHHHGIQSSERFGDGIDPDGDGFVDEATRADVTALAVYHAVLPVPGRVIPLDRTIEDAVLLGERRFRDIGCTSCHVERLPLEDWGWFYSEPNPYNPPGNLRIGEAPAYLVNLNSRVLPRPRLREEHGVTWVPAYTDMKLHDITSGPGDPNREALNMHFAAGSEEFFAGNGHFLTKRLWGAANEAPYFHHGKFMTLREAVLAHAGEAQAQADAFRALPDAERDAVIEFLKTLQVLPPGTTAAVVDHRGRARPWPPQR